MNPLHRYVITVAQPAAATDVAMHKPALSDSFDVNDVAELLDELNPRSVTDIRHLLDDYYPIQLFEALQKANLHTRLGLKSPMELQP